MADDPAPREHRCSACNRVIPKRMSLSDPVEQGRRLDVFECQNCGKVDLKLFEDDSPGPAAADEPTEPPEGG